MSVHGGKVGIQLSGELVGSEEVMQGDLGPEDPFGCCIQGRQLLQVTS